jgi:Na+/H+ antiporter NhaD/arsenite permease-like protein
MTISAILSGLMDEASSIIIMTKVILELTDFLEIDPIPLLIPAILATNIGSSATVLGNPIGVFIASKGGFTFEDFIRHALPITLIVLGVVIAILMFWYRNYIKILDEKLKNFRQNTFFLSLITVPPDRHTKIGMAMFVVTLLGISLHRRLEILFLLTENTLLFIIPLVAAGIVMIYNRDKARQYVDNEVEWTSLLFFMFLFAEAGAMEYCGVGGFFTHKLAGLLQQGRELFLGIILFSSGLLSSILDNTVVVASYVPLMETLQKTDPAAKNLWWAVLFGACYGGNITVIGSTANIIAMSILEKNKKIKVNFFVWLKIGLVVGLVSMGIAFGIMVFLPNYK